MKSLVGCIVLAVALAAPAAAQDEAAERARDRFMAPDIRTGTRFLRAPETAQESDARQMQKRLARCVFYGSKDELRGLLANSDFDRIDFDGTKFGRETFFDQLDFGNCLGRAMTASQYKIRVSMPYSTLRNLLAEEAYLHDNKKPPSLAPGAPTVIKARYALTEGGPRAGVMAELADCITFRDTAKADAFLREYPGSKGEGAALEALAPTLLTCLETEEMPNLSPSMVRQVIADGLWARSHYGAFAAAAAKGAVIE